MSWREQAACRLAPDPEVFFVDLLGGDKRASRPAKRICWTCPVQTECLDYALARNEPWGIWGGLTAPERRKLQQQRRKEALLAG